MEYYLCRAMEVCRLNEEQLIQLYTKEKNTRRGLNPCEIQELFKLPTLKEHYGIPPENDNAQANYNQKLRIKFRECELRPGGEDLSYGDLEKLKEFDSKVRRAFDELKLDFQFSLGKAGKRAIDEFER